MPKTKAVALTRAISEIAREIESLWGAKVNFAARPYLDAMKALSSLDDLYGVEYADMIVARFLGNATSWRGEDARRIKLELNQGLAFWNEKRRSA